MPPRKGQKEVTRARLLEAAARAFAARGYAACTVADIAREAGLSQGALYVHFAGKEKLFLSMIAEEHGMGERKAREAVAKAPYLESALTLMEGCVRDVGFPVDHALWTEILAVAARDERVRASFVRSDAAMRRAFTDLLRRAAAAGEIRSDLDFEAVGVWLYALVDGLIARKAVEPDHDLDRAMRVFRDLVRSALGAVSPDSSSDSSPDSRPDTSTAASAVTPADTSGARPQTPRPDPLPKPDDTGSHGS